MPPAFNCEHLFFTGNPSVGKTTLVIETTRAALSSSSPEGKEVRVRGFFTEECRRNGERVGFDIVHFPKEGLKASVSCPDLDKVVERSPLARSGAKGGGPLVGKYAVDLENIRNFAVPAIANEEEESAASATMIALDEVGKMEMLCPEFLPAVTRTLDSFVTGRPGMVLGTIPTPRYGRVMQAVEDIRARPDVTVVYVTKQNRDELRETVKEIVLSKLEAAAAGKSPNQSFATGLENYLYTRPIGASSMKSIKPKASRADSSSIKIDEPKPCDPLVHKSIKPKVLLLGETASPQPDQRGMEYSERSMWTVLGEIKGKSCSPSSSSFMELRDYVLGSGIAIWDVLSDVHVKSSQRRKGGKKRRTADRSGNPNGIELFLQEHASIEALAFIGAKARKTFANHFCAEGNTKKVIFAGRKIDLIELPSSSRANSRMSLAEKATTWEDVFVKYQNHTT